MDYKEWVFHDVSPIYLQLYEKITNSILNGKLSPSEDMPSIRQMAILLHINSSTVARAYQLVNQQNLIFRLNRHGYKVISDVLFIQEKRNEQRKILCCTYIRQMLELGYTKEEALTSISEFFADYLYVIEKS